MFPSISPRRLCGELFSFISFHFLLFFSLTSLGYIPQQDFSVLADLPKQTLSHRDSGHCGVFFSHPAIVFLIFQHLNHANLLPPSAEIHDDSEMDLVLLSENHFSNSAMV